MFPINYSPITDRNIQFWYSVATPGTKNTAVTNKLVHYAKSNKDYCKSHQKLTNTQIANISPLFSVIPVFTTFNNPFCCIITYFVTFIQETFIPAEDGEDGGT